MSALERFGRAFRGFSNLENKIVEGTGNRDVDMMAGVLTAFFDTKVKCLCLAYTIFNMVPAKAQVTYFNIFGCF